MQPPPVSGQGSPNRSSFQLGWPTLLFGLAILVYLGTTGFLPLLGRDEPRYVQIGREMLQSGDWITPRLGGFTWFEKPVLLYWMVAASFAVFGDSEWAARLGPALCGLGSAGLVWWMVRPTDERWARWSAVLSLTCGGMLAFSHGATFDIVLTFCLTLAMAAWWRAQQDARLAKRYLALFWAGIGLAFLSKGLVAFVLPLGSIGIYAALRRERVRLGFWWGLPLALLVSVLWYGPVIWVNGAKFINEFFVQHHFQRFTSNKYKHHEPFWYYLEVLPLLLMPWTPFLLWNLWKTRPGGFREDSAPSRLKTCALACMAAPLLFFTFSGSKLPGYVLPSLAGACVLAGYEVSQWISHSRRERLLGWMSAATLLAVALLTTIRPAVRLAERFSARRMFDLAHEQNLGQLRVANFREIQRPAQFYGARQLIYGHDGEPLCLDAARQVQSLANNEPLLLLVNDKDFGYLTEANLRLKSVADNGKVSLVLATAKANPPRIALQRPERILRR